MAKVKTQADWTCTEAGMMTGSFPGGLSVTYDLTLLFTGWDQMNEAEMFMAGYGVKQKCQDISADTKYTYQDKIDRGQALYDYITLHGKMPATKRGGGFGITKAVAVDVVSGVQAIMAKFNVAEEVAKGIQAELDKLNV